MRYLRYLPLAMRLIAAAIEAEVIETIRAAYKDRRINGKEAIDIVTKIAKVVGIEIDMSGFVFK